MSLQVTVRCFSHVREALGKETVNLELEDDADTSTVENKIREKYDFTGVPMQIFIRKK